jgi:hypothetical protein
MLHDHDDHDHAVVLVKKDPRSFTVNVMDARAIELALVLHDVTRPEHRPISFSQSDSHRASHHRIHPRGGNAVHTANKKNPSPAQHHLSLPRRSGAGRYQAVP